MKKYVAPVLLTLISSVVAFGIVELVLRFAYLQEPLTRRNFSVDPGDQQVSNIAIAYDPILGYIARPGFRGGDMNSHGEMGIRLNRMFSKDEPNPPIVKGGHPCSGRQFYLGIRSL